VRAQVTTGARDLAANPGRLRVLQVAGASAGGAWFHDQVTGLARLGHTVHAVLPGRGPLADRLLAAGIEVEIIPFGFTRRLRPMPSMAAAHWRLLRYIRSFQPDVIHAHLIAAVLACRAASAGCPAALRVAQMPGLPRLHNAALQWLDRRTLFRDQLVLGSCQAIAEQYRAMGARRVAISYYGCDVQRLDPGRSGAAFRREFGLAGDTPTVGMLAHMYRGRDLPEFPGVGVKGHEIFLDAAPLILASRPDARLFVIGDSLLRSGDYRRCLEARAAALGLAGRLHFTGHRADVAAVLAGLDVVVSPSIAESACYSMVEALLMGRGVVASDVGGLPDTVQHGETGLLVPPGDPAALAGAVTRLLADPARRQRMGRLGRSRCLHQFDIGGTVAQVDALYQATLRELRRDGGGAAASSGGELPGGPGHA
jgi:glycosyltransferase involved in cell wall biosynthesis